MSKRSFQVVRIAPTYAPGYPRKLTRAEFVELVESKLPPRMKRLAAVLAVTAGLAAWKAEETVTKITGPFERAVAPDDVAKRVLECFDEFRGGRHRDAAWRTGARVWRTTKEERRTGSPALRTTIPISFGNSQNGLFDGRAAREAARRVFGAYGLVTPATPISIRMDEVSADLDGFDAKRGVAFELRDAQSPRPRAPFALGDSEAETSRRARVRLEDSESNALLAQGVHVYLRDIDHVYDGDAVTSPTLYLLGLVDFLNEVTDGPDFDLRWLLDDIGRRVPLDARVEPASAGTVDWDDLGQYHVDLKGPGHVILEATAATMAESTPEYRIRGDARKALDEPNEPNPSHVIDHVELSRWLSDTSAVLVQSETIDGSPVRVEFANRNFVLPANFDKTKPFRIDIKVDASAASFLLPRSVAVGAIAN